jgi:hypothetical protein
MITQHPDLPITIPYHAIKALCEQYHIARLALFGSVLRDDFDPARSDIDVLVVYESGHIPGLMTISGHEIAFSEVFGRKVDLRTAGDLSLYFRQEVIDTSLVIYEQAQ